MSIDGYTQSILKSYFNKIIQCNNLSHAYLFVGKNGVGKLSLAHWIAKKFLCGQKIPCLKCDECNRIEQHQHPDVIEINSDEYSIKIDQIRYIKSEFFKSGLESNKKFFIINNADRMTLSAANSILKFIENPRNNTYIFLISSNINKILPTIISRCEVVRFKPLNLEEKRKILLSAGIDDIYVPLLLKINSSTDTIISLFSDNFKLVAQKVFCWMKLVLLGDKMAFVFIKTNLLFNDINVQHIIIQLITILSEDLLSLKLNINEFISFEFIKNDLIRLLSSVSLKKITDGLFLILKNVNQLSYNINYQVFLESLTLKLLKCYHKNN